MIVDSEPANDDVEDRLSSLPDDILIDVLSRLPLRLAVVIESLSHRWHGLWTNITSIDLTSCNLSKLPVFATQFSSPLIHSFVVELTDDFEEPSLWNSLDSWLRHVCDRNVRELKVLSRSSEAIDYVTLPSYIFRTQSLVSVELCSAFGLILRRKRSINLPNLKSLSLHHFPFGDDSIGRLINACPSLEDLCLTCTTNMVNRGYMNCSNQNLRRLLIVSSLTGRNKFVINAPKLEYLHVSSSTPLTFSFEVEPTALHEAKINAIDENSPLTWNEIQLISNFLGAICDVRILTLDVLASNNAPSVFRNATRVTLDMKSSHNIKFLSPLLRLCPVLDVLTITIRNICDKQEIIEDADMPTLQPSLKRIEIEAGWYIGYKPTKGFKEFVEYLLRNTINLEHFKLCVNRTCFGGQSAKHLDRQESKLCKLIHHHCPVISKGCEVEYLGRFLKMSRKIRKTNSKVIPMD